jgi:hypothetical protein
MQQRDQGLQRIRIQHFFFSLISPGDEWERWRTPGGLLVIRPTEEKRLRQEPKPNIFSFLSHGSSEH